MTVIKEILEGVYIVENFLLRDDRGIFCKKYTQDLFRELGITFSAYEEFYTKSKKNVIRGMHFTVPPFDQAKIISCNYGSVCDVVLDLRRGPNYGKFHEIILDANHPNLLVLPSGIAHGFISLADDSLLSYSADKAYRSDLDHGINFNSFGYDWKIKHPIVSKRDLELVNFSDFVSPFNAKK